MGSYFALGAKEKASYFCVSRFASRAQLHQPFDMPKKERLTKAQPIDRAVGQLMRTIRKDKRMTLEQVSGSFESDPGNLSRCELGQQAVLLWVLQGVAQALGMKMYQILEQIEEKGAARPIISKEGEALLRKWESLLPGAKKAAQQALDQVYSVSQAAPTAYGDKPARKLRKPEKSTQK